jgi:O-methyltransferase involved in polyketide biosynthesis
VSAIGPTAHYTGYVWARNGLSHPELETVEGRVLFESLRGVMAVSRRLGAPTLEGYLLARHRAIDAALERAIEERGVSQVLEVACGMSPRGWRFAQRYGDAVVYVEGDLPEMAARKRQALARMGALGDTHRVVELDALRDDGPGSLAAAAEELDAGTGLAIVTEGLLGYLPRDAVDGIWRRFAFALEGFAAGLYVSDIHIGAVQNVHTRAFRVLLSAFVRARVHLHFGEPEDVCAALSDAGFTQCEVRSVGELAHILEASTT